MRLKLDNKQHQRIQYDLLIIGSLTMIAVLIWTGYSLYDTFGTSTIEPDVAELLEPLDPNLDVETLTVLEDQFQPPEEFTILAVLRDESNNKQIVPIDQRDTATFSAQLSQTQSATDSATTNDDQ